MLKTIVAQILQVITLYTSLTIANMGTVLLVFQSGIVDGILSQLFIMIILISLSSYFIAKLVVRKMISHFKVVSIISLIAVIAVVLLSMIWDMSIEPNWYKLSYLATLLTAYLLGYKIELRKNSLAQKTVDTP